MSSALKRAEDFASKAILNRTAPEGEETKHRRSRKELLASLKEREKYDAEAVAKFEQFRKEHRELNDNFSRSTKGGESCPPGTIQRISWLAGVVRKGPKVSVDYETTPDKLLFKTCQCPKLTQQFAVVTAALESAEREWSDANRRETEASNRVCSAKERLVEALGFIRSSLPGVNKKWEIVRHSDGTVAIAAIDEQIHAKVIQDYNSQLNQANRTIRNSHEFVGPDKRKLEAARDDLREMQDAVKQAMIDSEI